MWLWPLRALGFEKAMHRIRPIETQFDVENWDPCVKCKPRSEIGVWMTNRVRLSVPASAVEFLHRSIAGEPLLGSEICLLEKPSPSVSRGFVSNLNIKIFPTKELVVALSGLDLTVYPHV